LDAIVSRPLSCGSHHPKKGLNSSLVFKPFVFLTSSALYWQDLKPRFKPGTSRVVLVRVAGGVVVISDGLQDAVATATNYPI
jgi:hypothetical protein